MRKINKYLQIGLLLVIVSMILQRFTDVPEFVHGILLGTGIVLEFIGGYSINHDISKLKNYKMNLFKKVFG